MHSRQEEGRIVFQTLIVDARPKQPPARTYTYTRAHTYSNDLLKSRFPTAARTDFFKCVSSQMWCWTADPGKQLVISCSFKSTATCCGLTESMSIKPCMETCAKNSPPCSWKRGNSYHVGSVFLEILLRQAGKLSREASHVGTSCNTTSWLDAIR